MTPTPARPALDAMAEEIERLDKLATAAPWFAHDHNDMAELGESAEKWIGYAWVGKPSCDPSMADQRRWDGGVATLDRRRDGHEDYRNKAAHDAALIAALRNNAPAICAALRSLADMREALKDVQADLIAYMLIHAADYASAGPSVEQYKEMIANLQSALARSAP